MGRPKGSKNKPKTTPEVSTTSSEEVKPKRHRRTKAEMEAYRASLKAQEDAINNIQSSLEDMTEILNTSLVNETILADSEKTEKEYKELEEQVQSEELVPATEETKEEVQETVEEVKKKKNNRKNKIQPQYPLCDCCEKEIYCSPHRIDTNILSAQVADYHRQSPRWVNLCGQCALELSDVVDRWLAGNGCLTKLEQREREKQREKEEKDG